MMYESNIGLIYKTIYLFIERETIKKIIILKNTKTDFKKLAIEIMKYYNGFVKYII